MKALDLLILRLLLVISKQPGLENEVPHVNKRPTDLSTAIPHHPPFVHNLRHLYLKDGETTSNPKLNSEEQATLWKPRSAQILPSEESEGPK